MSQPILTRDADEIISQNEEEHVVVPAGEEEEIHLPAPSIGPVVLSGGALLLLLSTLNQFFLIPAIPVLAFGLWRMIHFPEVQLHAHWLTGLNDRKMGMWIFLASEVLFFGSLIGAFLYFKLGDRFPDDIHEILSLPLATVGTSVLVISSFAVVMGLEALQANDKRVFYNWMGVTLLLGLSFLAIQAVEWTELFHHHIDEKTMFGTAFYVTTGFHGLHVFGGVAWLAIVLFRARFQNTYSGENYLGVELFGLYWHFVDIVWIVLFTVIYLIK
ncbi:MAG TPA: cytochrome c oxidase subunit 3 [Aggregatilineaceae bacterium]|nr:cytochrome c oxidase subunit 3 [Aggregatilineaceae bacterium]